MDTNYHINLVINTSSGHKRTNNDKQLAVEAESLYKEVVPAMIKAVQTGDWSKYCKSIENYDRFVWEQSHKGNEANMFANPKIKVGPSWLEQLWAPVFERIRIKIEMFRYIRKVFYVNFSNDFWSVLSKSCVFWTQLKLKLKQKRIVS